MEKVTYTPAEFAEIFDKERTWAYRQLYAGKVQAVTNLGRTMIPKTEVDRLLKEAGRYLGAKAKVIKGEITKSAKSDAVDYEKGMAGGGGEWSKAIQKRKRDRGKSSHVNGGLEKEKPSPSGLGKPDSRSAALRRLVGKKH